MTEVGEAYYERCKRVLAEFEETDLLVEQLHSEPRGTLKVSAPMSFGVAHLGPAVSDFLSEYRELRISLTLNDRFTDLIEEGFDVAIRIAQSADSSLIRRRLSGVRCVMIATPEYLECKGVPTKPQDLSDHQCLSYSYLASGLEWPIFGPNGATSVKVSGPLKANNGEVLLQAARQNLGIAFRRTSWFGKISRRVFSSLCWSSAGCPNCWSTRCRRQTGFRREGYRRSLPSSPSGLRPPISDGAFSFRQTPINFFVLDSNIMILSSSLHRRFAITSIVARIRRAPPSSS